MSRVLPYSFSSRRFEKHLTFVLTSSNPGDERHLNVRVNHPPHFVSIPLECCLPWATMVEWYLISA